MPVRKPDKDYDPRRVDASPTKQLYISIITRDIELSRAIADLVDNSIDGATSTKKKNLTGYEVMVSFDKLRFTVSDNCGGIDIDAARKFAFPACAVE